MRVLQEGQAYLQAICVETATQLEQAVSKASCSSPGACHSWATGVDFFGWPLPRSNVARTHGSHGTCSCNGSSTAPLAVGMPGSSAKSDPPPVRPPQPGPSQVQASTRCRDRAAAFCSFLRRSQTLPALSAGPSRRTSIPSSHMFRNRDAT